MKSSLRPNRKQAWFRPGRYVPVLVPVSNFRGVEVLEHPRGGVQVGQTTIHGTVKQLRALAAQLLRAADAIAHTSSHRHADDASHLHAA